MSATKKLALIAVGYALSVAGGLAIAGVNELFMPAEISQTSPGMVAFGDMILFLLCTGFFSLAPTWFLLKLSVEKAPRILLVTELLIAAMGPTSWLAVIHFAGGPPLPSAPQAAAPLLGLLIAFGAIPRIVAGPILLVIEGATFLLIHGRVTRALLVAAMLMDLVPLSMFALHMAEAPRY